MIEKNILIPGLAGVRKTTLMKKFYEVLKDFPPVGFYTREIGEGSEKSAPLPQ